jgi:chromosome segregation ATPase
MVTEGRAVFEQIDRARHAAGQEVERGRAEAARLEGQLRELVATRGTTLVELARHYLPEISRPNVERSFAEVRDELTAILAQKEQKARELHESLGASNEEAARTNAELDGVTDRLNEKVRRREELEARVADELKADPEFQRLSKAALEAEQILHRNEQRVEEIRREAAEKLPAFDASRLFRYLYDRGYATPQYRAHGLIARLDRWVARLIDFPRARKGYEYLRRVPAMVEDEVRRRRQPFDELMQQVEAIQEARADAVGLTAVLEEGLRLGEARDRLVQELARTREESGVLERSLADLGRQRNAYYERAIETLKGFMERAEARVLEQRARQSPEPQDDALVSQIVEVGRSIADLNARLGELALGRQAAEQGHRELEDLARRYRQANFDSERSFFDGDLDVSALIDGCSRGQVGADAAWDRLRRAQRFRPHWVEPAPAPAPIPRIPGLPPGSMHVPDAAWLPAGRILIGALGEIVGAAMRDSANRGVRRRAETWSMPSPGPPPAPSPPSSGGFTSGEGF